MLVSLIKKIFPFKFKRKIKEHLGVPSLHWSLHNLKRKNFIPQVIIDIGAYEGFWTEDVLEVFPSSKVLMVEAQNSKEPFLRKIKDKYHNTEYVISLLSSEDGAIKTFAENETASQIVTVTKEQPGLEYKRIRTQSLDTLLNSLHFPLPDLLKLDVQGHELDVLKGAKNALSHSTVCLLEISLLNLGDNSPLLTEMVAFMDNSGFQAYDISHFIRRPFDKALYQVDMFFVKKNSFLVKDKIW